MIMTRTDFLARARLDQQTLDVWIEEEWLVPAVAGEEAAFSDADIARAHLILDLVEKLGVNSEGIGVILHLLDQVHGLRFAMAGLLESARNKDGGNA
jgi:chaperone modulatory protein CbpM